MFSTCRNSQKRVKNQISTDKHSSFDGLIQKDIDLSDIYLAVLKNIHVYFYFISIKAMKFGEELQTLAQTELSGALVFAC